MSDKYILDKDHNPVLTNDLKLWGEFFNKPERIIKQDYIGNIHVSTVFLGIDHSWGGNRPILFETMIFGGEHDQYQDRYYTWDEAVKGHEKARRIVLGEDK